MFIFPHVKESTMTRHALVATLMLSVFAMQPVFADDAHHPDQKAGAATPITDQTVQKMQVNTKRMQSQLEQMARSKDPAQRQKLMQEHMQTMQENMMAGKSSMAGAGGGMGMMDCPMMKDGMMGGGMGMMGGKGGMGMMGGDDMMAKRMEMMEKRMDMMQMMMQTNMGKPQGGQ
ncbi:hypothetical protein [Thiobacillus sp. 65-1402]|uniref:hypothetical protein n=1 Tax=Thiobacillus sp. 65-1402 TaxID=1895861 RepID=UPI0025EB478F|nr:hypothetical protein [Thiobacillus sp. 65-1402]